MPSNEYALLIFMDILLLQKIVKINMPKISFSIVKNADINLKQWIYFLSIKTWAWKKKCWITKPQ